MRMHRGDTQVPERREAGAVGTGAALAIAFPTRIVRGSAGRDASGRSA